MHPTTTLPAAILLDRAACRCGPPPPHRERPPVTTPEEADGVLRPLMAGLDRERCVVLSLDSRRRLLATDLVSIGTAITTFMAPREIFRDALLRGASSVVLAHNHPSGDPAPSDSDVAITRRLARAGTTIGIDVADHLVIGDVDFVSLSREGVL